MVGDSERSRNLLCSVVHNDKARNLKNVSVSRQSTRIGRRLNETVYWTPYGGGLAIVPETFSYQQKMSSWQTEPQFVLTLTWGLDLYELFCTETEKTKDLVISIYWGPPEKIVLLACQHILDNAFFSFTWCFQLMMVRFQLNA